MWRKLQLLKRLLKLKFIFEVIRYHRSAFKHQIEEACEIKWSKANKVVTNLNSIWTVIVRTKYHMDILLIVVLTSMWKLVSCSWIEALGNFGVGTFDKFWQLPRNFPASHNARGTSKHDSCKTFDQFNLAQCNFKTSCMLSTQKLFWIYVFSIFSVWLITGWLGV